MRMFWQSIAVLCTLISSGECLAGQPGPLEPPPKPMAGWTQSVSSGSAFVIETNVSEAYTKKVAAMITRAEQRFYTLFKLTPELLNGVSKTPFDQRYRIPGDYLSGFRQWIEVRVFKTQEDFSNEWFDLTGVKDKMQRLRQGIPGAYTGPRQEKDSDGKAVGKTIRIIRSFAENRDDDELERTLLHEMGHLFTTAFLLEYSGAPPAGKENARYGTPAWLGEGVAQLFENLWSNAASAQKARLRQQAMIYEAAQIGDSYPFDKFIEITNAHNLKDVAGDPLGATLNYAQSASVMDYMVNVDGKRFFDFLENLRAKNVEKNLMNKDKNHVRELFSFQDECFQKAFNCSLTEVEKYWKDHIKKTMEAMLKKQPEYYYWIGEYYLRRGKDKNGDLSKAEEKFNQALTLAPTKGEGYLGMGRMAIRKKDDENALKLLQKATELLPKDDDAWYYYGIAQVNVGKLKEACDSFNKSLKIFPDNHRTLAGLGQAAFHAGNYELSMQSYEKAYLAQRNPYYMFEKGHAAFFGKNYREAMKCFNIFSEWFPNDAQGAIWYALAAWRLNDKEFAMKKMQEAKKLNPNDGLINQALELAKKGETLTFVIEKTEEKEPPKDNSNPFEKGSNGGGEAKGEKGEKKGPIRIEDE